MFFALVFVCTRIPQIITLIPIMGMLAWFINVFVAYNALTPASILILITSVLALAWAVFTLFSYHRSSANARFVALVDIAIFGTLIAAVYQLRGIAGAGEAVRHAQGLLSSCHHHPLLHHRHCHLQPWRPAQRRLLRRQPSLSLLPPPPQQPSATAAHTPVAAAHATAAIEPLTRTRRIASMYSRPGPSSASNNEIRIAKAVLFGSAAIIHGVGKAGDILGGPRRA